MHIHNAHVTVANRTKEAFDAAMRLVFQDVYKYATDNSRSKQYVCTGWKVIEGRLFLSKYSKECIPFAYDYNIQQTIDFAWGWWEHNQPSEDTAPSTDGSVEPAWLLTTEHSGVGSRDWGMFVSIEPIWFVYGK